MKYTQGNPETSKIVLVGEAPGEVEVATGLPFMGRAGKELNAWLMEAGIPRASLYITNVGKVRPPLNRIENIDPPLPYWIDLLSDELATCTNTNVFVALGATALKALTGIQKITKHRGSILSATLPGIFGRKVVTTYHPSAIIRGTKNVAGSEKGPTTRGDPRTICIADMNRVREEGTFPELNLPNREMLINPCKSDVDIFCYEASKAKSLSVDIETRSRRIACIGLSYNPSYGICIPFERVDTDDKSYWNIDDEIYILHLINDLLTSHPNIITQNGFYDWFYLHWYGIKAGRINWDTMYMHQLLYPDMPKGLDFLCSLYTRQPYYKDEGQAWRKTMEEERFWRYNILDACCTLEVQYALENYLREASLLPFYDQLYRRLMPHLLHISLHGFAVDTKAITSAINEIDTDMKDLQAAVNTVAGSPLNVNSTKEVAKLLYEILKFKPIIDRKTKSITTNKKALVALASKNNHPIFDAISTMREKMKVRGTYLLAPRDVDDRIRTQYNIGGTETGRLSSSETPFGTGTNLQNVPKGPCRRVIIPDPGNVFVRADYSQAEARVVAYVAEETTMINVFESGGDIHIKSASLIYKIPEDQITPAQRRNSKKIVHACNYVLTASGLAEDLRIPVGDAKIILTRYFNIYPNILAWHMTIGEMVRNNKPIINLFGRPRTFSGYYTQAMLREAVCTIPQGTVGDLLNLALIAAREAGLNVVHQIHDEILVQCAPDKLEHTCQELTRCMAIPMNTNGQTFTIPINLATGPNWNDMEAIII